MHPTIVVTRKIHPDALTLLSRHGELQVFEGDEPIPPMLLKDWLSSARACLCMLTDRITADVLDSADRLQIIANLAVGYDNFDVGAASKKGIMLTNTPDVLTEATAELTWALMLALARQLVPSHQAILANQWKAWSPDGFLSTQLTGKTLGIAGLGRIGTAVARRAPAFGMSVVAWQRQDSERSSPDGILRLNLKEFLQRSDVVSLHLPLTPDTREMVNHTWFQHMKPTAFLINTARGGLIQERALKEALDLGYLKGAALDVFNEEPQGASHPLVSHPLVLATPHIGSATAETRRAMALRAATNIVAALTDQMPPDLLNAAFLAKA